MVDISTVTCILNKLFEDKNGGECYTERNRKN